MKIHPQSPKRAIDLAPFAQSSLGLRPLRGIGLTDQLLILAHLRVLLALTLDASAILLVEYLDYVVAQMVLHVSLVAVGLLRVHRGVVVREHVFVEAVGGFVAL